MGPTNYRNLPQTCPSDEETRRFLFNPEDHNNDTEYLTLEKAEAPCDTSQRYWKKWTIALGVILFITMTVMAMFVLSILQRGRGPCIPDPVYSPAEHLVKYKNVVFGPGVPGKTSEYMGPPTAERQKAWEELYLFGLSKIPMHDAAKLVNRTAPIPDYPGFYAIELDVFHQLHCLNALRRKIWNANTTIDHGNDYLHHMQHIDHCIDSIRQSLMCSSDIAPLPWSWKGVEGMNKGDTGIMHTCRDFEALREWGIRNHAERFEARVRVEDPLEG